MIEYADHGQTLNSRDNLALAYRAAGRTDEAIELHTRTLTDRERILGTNHPHTRTSRRNLALAYEAAGRTDEAHALRSNPPRQDGQPSDRSGSS